MKKEKIKIVAECLDMAIKNLRPFNVSENIAKHVKLSKGTMAYKISTIEERILNAKDLLARAVKELQEKNS